MCFVRLLPLLLISLFTSVPLFSQNRCIRLDGKNDYIDFGNIYRDLVLPFTISAWVNVDPSNFLPAPVFSSRNCVSAYSGFWLVVDKNYMYVGYGDGYGKKHPAFRRGKEATVNLPTGQWHHVAAVVKDHMSIELFLDGVNVGGEITGSSTYSMNSSAPTGFASVGYLVSNDVVYRFKGAIDDIRIWNRALTLDEVANSMCNVLTGKEPGLIGYWDFNEPSGNAVLDKSPKKIHGKFIGKPVRVAAVIPCPVTKAEEK